MNVRETNQITSIDKLFTTRGNFALKSYQFTLFVGIILEIKLKSLMRELRC